MSDSEKITRRQLLRGRIPRQPLSDTETPKARSADKPPVQSKEDPAKRIRGSRTIPLVRPPGAVDEAVFLNRCTRCDLCAKACPHDAIIKAPARFRTSADTPMIDPAQAPCLMCEDMPCIAACPEEALVLEALGPIAEARILDYNCLAHQGSFCSICHEHCPGPDAITVVAGRPTVNLESCTGCGICHHVCPAPTNAIAIMPLTNRPTFPIL